MSKKDFVLVANTIRELREELNGGVADNILNGLSLAFANKFSEQNERFDRLKFFRACGCKGA